MAKLTPDKKHVVIIGGGLTGLSAAWQLQAKAGNQLEITIVEAGKQLGGKMQTKVISHNGASFIIDAGPESFVTRKPEAWRLAQELGLAGEVINPGSETRNMYVLDQGVVKQIPLSPPAFIKSDLLSLKGKLRMFREPFIKARRDDEDESLAAFVTRRLGQEALEKMLGPVLSGIYNTNPETQSIMVTSPVMREMEKEYGGLVKGALGRMRKRKKGAAETNKPPQFITFSSGAQVMIDAIENQFNGVVIKGTRALNISNSENNFTVKLSNKQSLSADAVVLAAPANHSALLLQQSVPEAAALMKQIVHKNIGTASLIFRSDAIALPFQINGLMIPRREKRKIDAITWTTNKPMPRAPEGYEMIRVFFGGGDPDLVNLTDKQILIAILSELKDILNIDAQPLNSAIFTWPNGFPQAFVGHLDLVNEIETKLPTGIWAAGSSYRGIGVPDCIRQGQHAANKVISYLNISNKE
ncbi:MAG: protoporphyrinogen oxidase [Chloroflexota bacterium]